MMTLVQAQWNWFCMLLIDMSQGGKGLLSLCMFVMSIAVRIRIAMYGIFRFLKSRHCIVCSVIVWQLASGWTALINLMFMVPYILVTYVQFKVQLDVLFYVFLFFFILSSTCFGCYLHPSSGAQLRRTAIRLCMVLVCYSIGAGTGWDTLTLLAQSISDSWVWNWLC
jgi:hypothetical protein